MRSGNAKFSTVATVIGLTLLVNGGLVACSKQSADAFVSEAKEYRQKGDKKAAIIQLKNALQKEPENPEARYLLGNVYNDIGDWISAEKELRKAVSLGMTRETVVPGLSKALLMQGRFQQALDETGQVPVEKQSAELSTLRGNAYLALGKLTEAKASFDRALKDKADHPDALIGLARHMLVQKDVAGAMHLSEQAVSANPNNPDTWQFKADLLRAQGKIEPALAAYDQVLKLKPGDPGAHIAKATLEIHAKKFDAAKVDIDAARKSAPNGPLVLYTQALYDHSQGKHAAAWESLQQVLRVSPDHMPSVLLAGAVQMALGSTLQAEQHLRKYLDKNPGDTHANTLLATALLRNGQTERAITMVNAGLKHAPEDPQLLALAGESYMKARDFPKATKYLEKASELNPRAAPIQTALAMSRLAQGDNSRAIAELEQAINLDGKSAQPGILLVLTHIRLNDYDKALAAVKTLEKEQPDNPLVRNLKGTVQLFKKDAAGARASFEKAHALKPDYFPAVGNLALLDMQEKKEGAATKRLAAFLEKDKKHFQAMASLAGIAMSRGQKEEATRWLERAARDNPDELQPALTLSSHYLGMGENQKALAQMQKLHSTQPANAEVLNMLAQAQLANKDASAALESYKKVAVATPNSAAPYMRIATTYMALQNPAAASESLKKALSLQPDFLDAQLMQAALDARTGRHEQALSMARQIQKQRSKSPVGYVLEGDVLMGQDKAAPALKAYEQAFALNKSGPVLVKVHNALSKVGKEKDGDARIMQWLKEHPDDPTTRIYIGTRNLFNGQANASVEHFEAILQKDPKNAAAMNNLAIAFQQLKDTRALEYAEKANKLAPDNAGVMDTLGWILIEQGDTKRGLPLVQKAASLAPQSAEIQYHLVLGLVKSGDKVKARKELEQLLASGKQFSRLGEAKELMKQL
jgi:putative PEP-CTERM system TPR-repeat lipoprotein